MMPRYLSGTLVASVGIADFENRESITADVERNIPLVGIVRHGVGNLLFREFGGKVIGAAALDAAIEEILIRPFLRVSGLEWELAGGCGCVNANVIQICLIACLKSRRMSYVG
jgi:hypothetical protein